MKIQDDLREILKPLTVDWNYTTKHDFYECVKSFITSFGITEFDELSENELIRVSCELRGIKFEALNKDGELMYLLNKGENYRRLVINKSVSAHINDYLDNSDYKNLLSIINLKYSVEIGINLGTIIVREKSAPSTSFLLQFKTLSIEYSSKDLFFKEVVFNIGLDKFQLLNLVDEEIQSVKTIEVYQSQNEKVVIKNMTIKECCTLLKSL